MLCLNKPDTERQTLYDSTCMGCLEESVQGVRKCWKGGCQGLGSRGSGVTAAGFGASVGTMKKVLEVDGLGGYTAIHASLSHQCFPPPFLSLSKQ